MVVLRVMSTRLVRQIVSPIVPYVTIGIGLLVFHNAWLAILGYHAGMAAVILLSGKGFAIKQTFQGRGYLVPLLSALAGLGGGFALYLLWPLLSLPADLNTYARSLGLNGATWPAFLVYFIAINPLIEEYYWRGYLGSDARLVTFNDLLFSGYHLIVLSGHMQAILLIAAFVSLTGVAWFWRQVNRVNGGLLASIVSHLAADTVIMLTIYSVSTK